MIMVDELREYPNAKASCFRKGACHLTTDGSIRELHAFAERIGMKRIWVQRSSTGVVHYDITASRRKAALKAGAVFVPAKEQARARIAAHEAQRRSA